MQAMPAPLNEILGGNPTPWADFDCMSIFKIIFKHNLNFKNKSRKKYLQLFTN